jgi:hypothetical protein
MKVLTFTLWFLAATMVGACVSYWLAEHGEPRCLTVWRELGAPI